MPPYSVVTWHLYITTSLVNPMVVSGDPRKTMRIQSSYTSDSRKYPIHGHVVG